MSSLKSHRMLRIISLSILILLPLIQITAQEDPDPNSPTPVLLSENDSTRALATSAGKSRTSGRLNSSVYWPDQKIEMYVTNIDLMDGEGANAFRVYVQDAKGREYRFPVLEIRPSEFQKDVYTVVVELTDNLRYWAEAPESGDVLVRLTWRGLASNRVRLALGSTGGSIKDDPGAVPTPLSSVTAPCQSYEYD